jgi:hypothetical protein
MPRGGVSPHGGNAQFLGSYAPWSPGGQCSPAGGGQQSSSRGGGNFSVRGTEPPLGGAESPHGGAAFASRGDAPPRGGGGSLGGPPYQPRDVAELERLHAEYGEMLRQQTQYDISRSDPTMRGPEIQPASSNPNPANLSAPPSPNSNLRENASEFRPQAFTHTFQPRTNPPNPLPSLSTVNTPSSGPPDPASVARRHHRRRRRRSCRRPHRPHRQGFRASSEGHRPARRRRGSCTTSTTTRTSFRCRRRARRGAPSRSHSPAPRRLRCTSI